MPPLDGGGFDRNSWPRYSTLIGSRSITSYAARSSSASAPPPAATCATIRSASSPAIENRRAVAREPVERVAEIRDREPVAQPVRPPAAAVHRVALRRVAQQPIENRVQVPLHRRQLEAVARERRRRRDELRPRHPPPAAMRVLEAERRPGHRHRRRARPEQLLRVAVEVDRQLEQLGGRVRRLRHRHEEVEHRRLRALRLVDEHEAAAARAGQRALAHPRDERGRHARVHGAAARPEHPGARLRGQRMTRCDRSFHFSFIFDGNPAPNPANLKFRCTSDDMKSRT